MRLVSKDPHLPPSGPDTSVPSLIQDAGQGPLPLCDWESISAVLASQCMDITCEGVYLLLKSEAGKDVCLHTGRQ